MYVCMCVWICMYVHPKNIKGFKNCSVMNVFLLWYLIDYENIINGYSGDHVTWCWIIFPSWNMTSNGLYTTRQSKGSWLCFTTTQYNGIFLLLLRNIFEEVFHWTVRNKLYHLPVEKMMDSGIRRLNGLPTISC